jgi:DNA polymerase-1
VIDGITLPGYPCLDNVRRLDISIIPMVRRIQRNGMMLDIPGMQGLSAKFDANMRRIDEQISGMLPASFLEKFTGETFNVDSAPQVAELLFDALGVGRGQKLKTTPSGTRQSTGKKQLEMLRGEHPVIPLILEYRENAKMKSGFSEGLQKRSVLHSKGKCCSQCGRRHYTNEWRVHPEITTTRTGTGRLSCKAPNLQTIPVRSELGREVRAMFLAGEGRKLISCDFSQIELRLLAHCANELSMIEVFKNNGDIHTATAMDVFGLAKEQIDPIKHRLPCKNVGFMCLYGSSASGLQLQLALSGLFWSLDTCEKFIAAWFAKRPGVRAYMDEQHYHARRYGYVWELAGRVRLIPEIRSAISKVVEAGLRQAGNHRIQGTAATLMKLTMIEMTQIQNDIWDPAHFDAEPLMTIHDELIYEVEEDEAETVGRTISRVMDGCVELRVPVRSDWKVGKRWKKE